MKQFFLLAVSLCTMQLYAQNVQKSIPKPKNPNKPKTKPFTDPTGGTANTAVLKTLKDSASYSLGINIARNIKAQIGDVNMELLQRGLNDIFNNKPSLLPDESANNCIGDYQQKAQTAKAAVNKAKGKAFLAENAKKPGVVTLPNGIQYVVLKAGTDTVKPSLQDTVKCHYHGTLIDGTVFDSSVERGEPISFPLNGVIKGWQEALQLMTVGSKWKIFIPSELAYGDNAAGPKIGAGSTLIFEVELLSVQK